MKLFLFIIKVDYDVPLGFAVSSVTGYINFMIESEVVERIAFYTFLQDTLRILYWVCTLFSKDCWEKSIESQS